MNDAVDVDTLIQRLADELESRLATSGRQSPLMVGVHTGGVWVARRLHGLLGIQEPLGTLNINFYRDDFTRIGMHPCLLYTSDAADE